MGPIPTPRQFRVAPLERTPEVGDLFRVERTLPVITTHMAHMTLASMILTIRLPAHAVTTGKMTATKYFQTRTNWETKESAGQAFLGHPKELQRSICRGQAIALGVG